MSSFDCCLQEEEELSIEKWHESYSILLVYIFYCDPV